MALVESMESPPLACWELRPPYQLLQSLNLLETINVPVDI